MLQLHADCALLEELKVMDYSLLLGVHVRSNREGYSSAIPTDRDVRVVGIRWSCFLAFTLYVHTQQLQRACCTGNRGRAAFWKGPLSLEDPLCRLDDAPGFRRALPAG